jgi:hypothetical protein
MTQHSSSRASERQASERIQSMRAQHHQVRAAFVCALVDGVPRVSKNHLDFGLPSRSPKSLCGFAKELRSSFFGFIQEQWCTRKEKRINHGKEKKASPQWPGPRQSFLKHDFRSFGTVYGNQDSHFPPLSCLSPWFWFTLLSDRAACKLNMRSKLGWPV